MKPGFHIFADVNIGGERTNMAKPFVKFRAKGHFINTGCYHVFNLIRFSVLAIYLLVGIEVYGQDYQSGTAVVIYRTPETIIIGADSKFTTPTDSSGTICKIRFFSDENIGFAFAGIINSKTIGYDAVSIAVEACRVDGNIFDKFKYFSSKIEYEFIRVLNILSEIKSVTITDYSVQFAFFGIVDNIPSVSIVKIYPDSTFKDSGTYYIKKKSTNRRNIYISKIYFLGEHNDMFLNLNKFKVEAPVSSIVELINVGIAKTPESIGGPIDILRVDRNGFQWIQKKNECN